MTANNYQSAPYQSTYMMRMNDKQVPRSGSQNGGNYHYESSYMKKIHENPAPSITQSFSFGSKNAANRTSQQIPHRYQGSPAIRTTMRSVETATTSYNFTGPSQPLSPAETINAILCEQNNGREDSPKQYNPSFSSYGLHKQRQNPSPERIPISKKTSDENLASHFNYISLNKNTSFSSKPKNSAPSPVKHTQPLSSNFSSNIQTYKKNRSFSPQRSRSISPEKRLKPHPSMYRNEIQTSVSRDSLKGKKLPHETRNSSPSKYRKYRSAGSFTAPFWTQVSVKVSSELLKAGKPNKLAEAAQIAIVQAGEDQYDTSKESLNFVASVASLAVIEAGGDANTAAIATVACLRANDNTPSTEAQVKKEIEKAMIDIKNRASVVAQSTYDGGAKAANYVSNLASKGFEDFKAFSEKSFRQYRTYQRNYILERQNNTRRLSNSRYRDRNYRRYRDSRDDDTLSDDDRRNRRRRGSSRGKRTQKYESDESSDYHRRRGRRSRRQRGKYSTFDSVSYSSSASSFSSRTLSSASSSDSSGKNRRASAARTDDKKAEKKRGEKYVKSASSSYSK